MEDREIIRLFLARDENAIKELDKKFRPLAKHIAFNILGNEEDAEECINDAYYAVWNNIPPADPNSLPAYLGTIVRNISNVHHGNPHNIVLSSTVPTGAIFISTIHTHPNSNNPSGIDYNGVSSGHYNYVVIPQHKVLKYDSSSYTSIFDSNGTAYFETPELTSSEKVQYASQLYSVWNNHWNNPDLNDPCSDFHCETMKIRTRIV